MVTESLLFMRRFGGAVRTIMEKKSCYASEKNKQPILEVLKPRVDKIGKSIVRVLEIASGTGEHADYFLKNINNLRYQPTEPMVDMHDSIRAWTAEYPETVLPPVSLDVNDPSQDSNIPEEFSIQGADVMICINMIHISPFSSTRGLFRIASKFLRPDGFLLTYGPYRVNGTMVESNIAFDASLKQRNPEWGVRDLEAVEAVAREHGLQIKETISMPSNNLSVIFTKIA